MKKQTEELDLAIDNYVKEVMVKIMAEMENYNAI